MAVVPLYPPIRARSENPTSEQREAKKAHNYSVIAGVIVAVFVSLFIARMLWYKFGQPRLVRRQMAKRRRMQRESWYRSTRPMDRRPNCPKIGQNHGFEASVPLTRVQTPNVALVHQAPAPRIAEAHSATVSTLHVDNVPHRIDMGVKASGGSQSLSDSTSMQPRPLSEVSGAPQLTTSGLEPFPSFDPHHGPVMDAEGDLGIQPLRQSYSTTSSMDTTASIGVAVPVKVSRPGSPTEVDNPRPLSIADMVATLGVAVSVKLPEPSSPTEIYVARWSPIDAHGTSDDPFVIGDDDFEEITV